RPGARRARSHHTSRVLRAAAGRKARAARLSRPRIRCPRLPDTPTASRSLHPSVKVWATGDGIEITVESFDRSSIKGTFSGAFETPAQPGGPAAVRKRQVQAGSR